MGRGRSGRDRAPGFARQAVAPRRGRRPRTGGGRVVIAVRDGCGAVVSVGRWRLARARRHGRRTLRRTAGTGAAKRPRHPASHLCLAPLGVDTRCRVMAAPLASHLAHERVALPAMSARRRAAPCVPQPAEHALATACQPVGVQQRRRLQPRAQAGAQRGQRVEIGGRGDGASDIGVLPLRSPNRPARRHAGSRRRTVRPSAARPE